jgi:hypothetical protein
MSRAVPQPAPPVVRDRRFEHPWLVPAVALAVAVVGGILAVQRSWDSLAPLLFSPAEATRENGGSPLAAHHLPPLPRPADLALERARSLLSSGRLGEALAALETIESGDRLAPDADRLRTEIQRTLLASADSGSSRGAADR